MGWVTEFAPTNAELSACVQCGLCLPHCPTFRLTGKETASPRGRLMAMSAVAEGLADIDDAFQAIIGACLQCRACETVCPSLVPFGRAMEGTRVEVAAQRPDLAGKARHFLLGRALTWRSAVKVAGRLAERVRSSPVQRLVPAVLRAGLAGIRPNAGHTPSLRGETFAAHGEQVGRAALLTGCVMDGWFGDVHRATIEVLRHAGYEVSLPLDQTCCGALAAHDGDAADTTRLAGRNVEVFAGFDLVISNAAGCAAHLKEYGHWAGAGGSNLGRRASEVTEVLVTALDDGRLPSMDLDRGPVAVQDPCHNRHAQRIFDQPRRLLAAAGYRPIDVDPGGMCCGAAGAYSVQYPDIASELGRRKAAEVEETGTTIVATANPGCEMQLRGYLGAGYRVAHPVELYWEALASHMEASSTGR